MHHAGHFSPRVYSLGGCKLVILDGHDPPSSGTLYCNVINLGIAVHRPHGSNAASSQVSLISVLHMILLMGTRVLQSSPNPSKVISG